MKDNRLTNILLIVLIALIGLSFFWPSLDAAQTAQATTATEIAPVMQQDQDLTDGEKFLIKAQEKIAQANLAIAKAIDGHGDKLLEAAKVVATAIEKTIKE